MTTVQTEEPLPTLGAAYAIERVMRLPVILLGLLASRQIAVSVARDRSDAMQWRFQFGQRAILHVTEGVGWKWHTVTRNTRMELEPLILEAEAIAQAASGWVAELGGSRDRGPDWNRMAAARPWEEGPSLKAGRARHGPPAAGLTPPAALGSLEG